jgi:hypothetical protein
MKKLAGVFSTQTCLLLIGLVRSEVALHAQACLNASASGPQFQMSLLSSQTGSFTFEVDVTPKASGPSMDGAVSLALGQLGAFTDMAATVRFNPSGTIDMRNGAAYQADNTVSYAANQQVHIVMNINLTARTYSASVRNLDGSLSAIGANYSFRTEQQQVNSLDRWGVFADTGALSACDGVAYASLTPAQTLHFDGVTTYAETPDRDALSIATTGALTVSAWINPSTLLFPKTEDTGYVHFLGKGLHGQEEWLFRIYSSGNTENRGNRISFYVFNLSGGEGAGSYFQDQLTPGQWIHVVGVADSQNTYIYSNGAFRRCDQYINSATSSCNPPFVTVTPQHGTAPLRIGTTTLESFFKGSIRDVRIWNRALSASEISALYNGNVSRTGLVAEYLLEGDTAPDTTGGPGMKIFGSWKP